MLAGTRLAHRRDGKAEIISHALYEALNWLHELRFTLRRPGAGGCQAPLDVFCELAEVLSELFQRGHSRPPDASNERTR